MTTLAEDMKIGRRTFDGTLPLLNRGLELGRTLWDEFERRRSIRDLDWLHDRLLKDVGLFREHLPSGATRVRRR